MLTCPVLAVKLSVVDGPGGKETPSSKYAVPKASPDAEAEMRSESGPARVSVVVYAGSLNNNNAAPSRMCTLMFPNGASSVTFALVFKFLPPCCTTSCVNQSLQITLPRPGKTPETLETFGVSTGVTRMLRPTRNCLSTEKSSGSLGNSKKSARTGGVPDVDELAKRVYYARKRRSE